ncbi:MAG: nucleotidyltransferase family protein [Pseudomonas capeferrum]|uniref:nucleotidyltransferase family protein n=1 Tax=unclassified Pseudomonas TaxID=196821 RepID=UPI0023645382|nr:nucleotidyltransferase family protein [Pseudomonas sp. 39004]MDD1962499.1 nucleotidyltransferase family protein [Pseudomonas sp. 39004]
MPAQPVICAALVLAAGRAQRFGSDKRLARLPSGHTLLATALAHAFDHFAEVHVVLRPGDDAQHLGIDPRAHIVRAEQAALGMGASLAAGVTALLQTQAQAVAVLLADMPWIAPGSLQALCRQASAAHIVLPQYQGQRGHPVIFGRAFWPALAQLQGDQGGRQVMLDNPHACITVAVDDAGVVLDVDVPQALGLPMGH